MSLNRNLKSGESKFINRINKFSVYHFYSALSIVGLFFSLISFYIIYEEGFLGDGGIAFFLMLFFYVFTVVITHKYFGKKMKKQAYSKDVATKLSGYLGVKNAGFKLQHKIGKVNVEIPGHWEKYISKGEKVDSEVCFGEYRNYVLNMSRGLSVNREIENGYDELLAYSRGRNSCIGLFLVFAITFSGFLFVNLGITGDPSISRPTTITGFFNNWFEYGSLVLMAGFGIPSTWYIYRHFKQLSEVREMYEEEMGLEPA